MDKRLARFNAYHKTIEKSKLEAITNAYKLGYLDYTNGIASFYAIRDEDIKTLCLDLFLVQREQVNVVDMDRV